MKSLDDILKEQVQLRPDELFPKILKSRKIPFHPVLHHYRSEYMNSKSGREDIFKKYADVMAKYLLELKKLPEKERGSLSDIDDEIQLLSEIEPKKDLPDFFPWTFGMKNGFPSLENSSIGGVYLAREPISAQYYVLNDLKLKKGDPMLNKLSNYLIAGEDKQMYVWELNITEPAPLIEAFIWALGFQRSYIKAAFKQNLPITYDDRKNAYRRKTSGFLGIGRKHVDEKDLYK